MPASTEDSSTSLDAHVAPSRHPSLPEVRIDVIRRENVAQNIDRDQPQTTFEKTVLRVDLPGEPGGLGVVRKRLPGGGERGAVVFLHGYAQNRYTWHNPFRSLPNFVAAMGYDTYNVDLRGQGRSRVEFEAPMPDHPDKYIQRDVPAVVSAALHLSGAEQVILVGHSLGGAVSYAAAPVLVEAGVLRGMAAVAAVFGMGRNGFVRQLARIGDNFSHTEPPREFSFPLQWVTSKFVVPFQRLLDQKPLALSPFHGWYPGSTEPDVLDFALRNGMDQVTLGVTLALADWAIEGYFRSLDGVDYVGPFGSLRELPVFVVVGAQDVLLTPMDAEQAVLWGPGQNVEYLLLDKEHGGTGWGHLDIIMGKHAPRYMWAPLANWLERIT